MTTAASVIEVRVPDIGDFADVPVIEIHVAPGDAVALDDPLVTLESDKATMDVPAPAAGIVEQVLVKLDDRVSEGSTVLTLRGESSAEGSTGEEPPEAVAPASDAPASSAPAPDPAAATPAHATATPAPDAPTPTPMLLPRIPGHQTTADRSTPARRSAASPASAASTCTR